MDGPIVIDWVFMENSGPVNGVALMNNEYVWFSRVNAPSVISSTDISVPEVTIESTEINYLIFKISDEDREKLWQDHLAKCEKTGEPKKHGDPYRIAHPLTRNKTNITKLNPSNLKEFSGFLKGMSSNDVSHRCQIAWNSISGTYLGHVTQSQFTNFFVPRVVE